MATPRTIRFYDPQTKALFDPREPATTLQDVLNWSDDILEYRHDYIQHLFPLPERSGPNPSAPILTKEVRDAFHSRPELRQNLLAAFDRICTFYGLDITRSEAGYRAYENNTWKAGLIDNDMRNSPLTKRFLQRARDSWLTSFDHNHLRITRIIRSMRILGEPRCAHWLVTVMRELEMAFAPGTINSRSIDIWYKAATKPLNLPPDERQPECAWLRGSEGAGDGTYGRENYEKYVAARQAEGPGDVQDSTASHDEGAADDGTEETDGSEQYGYKYSFDQVRQSAVPQHRMYEAW